MIETLAQIQPALMAREWETLFQGAQDLKEITKYLHVDVMDGVLVPSKSFPYNKTRFSEEKLPNDVDFEVHLMVHNPEDVGIRFVQAGARRVVAQVEGFMNEFPISNFKFSNKENNGSIVEKVRHALRAWRDAGAERVGLSILLDTPLTQAAQFLDSGDIDYVQIMSINRVGYQGEKFDERALIRIQELKERYPNVIIEVDGGINEETILSVFNAGATICTVGSAIGNATYPALAYSTLMELTKE